MITIKGKDYYTWDEMVEIILYMQKYDITVERNDDYVSMPTKQKKSCKFYKELADGLREELNGEIKQ